MASGAHQPPGQEQRHTGVVRGGFTRRAPQSAPRRDWIAGGIVAGITVAALLILFSAFSGRPAEVALIPSATPEPTVESSLPAFVQESPNPTPTPMPTPTPWPTPTPTPVPTPTPTLIPWPTATPTPPPTEFPLPTATLEPLPTPTLPPPPTATPAPTPPVIALKVTAPKDGATVSDEVVLIKGKATPGATITRDVPLWFDEHTIADENGRWSFEETLNLGQNTFTFRIADDRSTEITLTVFLAAE